MAMTMMDQYRAMKKKYADCVLFYRLGDFYEMFDDDAVEVSRLLDLTLTGKDCGEKERAPMCGIPFHAADGYVAKLVSLGKKVAICEQLSDPKAKGLVERDVVRIVSAGTVIEEDFLDSTKNNYIVCAYKHEDGVALAWTDITTGEFLAEEYTGAEALQNAIGKILILSAAEIICNEDMLLASREIKEVQRNLLPAFSCYSPWAFNVKHAEKNLCEQFHSLSLAAYEIASKDSMIAAAGALIEYLRETQKHSLANINTVRVVKGGEYMELDNIAVRNLEIVKSNADGKKYGSLLWVLDKTVTGMGARYLHRIMLSPLHDIEKIRYRQDGVEELVNATVARMGLREIMRSISDIERLAGKISNGNMNPKNCIALGKSLSALPSLKFQLTGFTSKILTDINGDISDMKEIAELLRNAIDPDAPAVMREGGYINKGYNAELDRYRDLQDNAKRYIKEIEEREREKTGIKTLKTGFNRVFGYYIEISNSFKDKVPETYIRKQTLVNGERYITEELKTFEEQVLSSRDNALALEAKLYGELMRVLLSRIGELQKIAVAIAALDTLVSFATVAKERRYSRPTIVEGEQPLSITDGRHPVVEAISRERFVPNDTVLDNEENSCMIITGPNMAGKSTYMRQVALIVLMAHIGAFVPARSAQIPLTDRIFTRVGASDNLIMDQSTFMVEMTEVASILLRATRESLLVLDEVGRGTSTYDGLSIAWSVVEFLAKKVRAKTLFSTHYHELTELEDSLAGVKNYKITVRELNGSIVFLRKIVRGGANRSFGIEVAALAGVPKEVTQRAKQILKALEKANPTSGAYSIGAVSSVEESEAREYTEVEQILLDTDVNTLSPMQALLILNDLKEKLNAEK